MMILLLLYLLLFHGETVVLDRTEKEDELLPQEDGIIPKTEDVGEIVEIVVVLLSC